MQRLTGVRVLALGDLVEVVTSSAIGPTDTRFRQRPQQLAAMAAARSTDNALLATASERQERVGLGASTSNPGVGRGRSLERRACAIGA